MGGTQPENPYTTRLRRMLRLRQALAAGLVVAAVAVAGVYFWGRHQRASEARAHPVPKPALVGLKIEQTAGGVTISKSENGRPVFRVFAQRADKMRQGARDLLHQVRILVYDEDGVHADEISGQDFGYNEASGELSAQGNVHITLQARPGSRGQTGAPMDITARDLSYNVKLGTGTIAQGIEFSMGGAKGSAGSATLDSHGGRAAFAGGIALRWNRAGRPDLVLHSQTAWIEREAGASDAAKVHLEGDVHLEQAPESLRAASMDLRVRSDQTLSDFKATGDVAASESRADGMINAQAQRVHATFADDGFQTLSGLELSGGVKASEKAPEGDRSLAAGQMRFEVDRNGNLQRLIASQNARLDLAGAEPAMLAAPELDFTFARADNSAGTTVPRLSAIASAAGRAHLQRGTDEAEADNATIELDARQQPSRVRAQGNVDAREQAGSLRSGSLDLRFATAAGSSRAQLATAVAHGHVQLAQGGRHVSADAVNYDARSGTAVCTGNVVAGDASTRLSAPALTFFSAADGSERMTVLDGVSVSMLAGAGAGDAALPSANAREPVAVSAKAMTWSGRRQGAQKANGVAVFTGGVRVMQAPNLLRSDSLRVDADRQQLLAEGHVLTSTQQSKDQGAVTVAAARLEYDAAVREAVYTGRVTMQQGSSRLEAPRLEVYLRPGGLERAVASQGVKLDQPRRRGTAETVDYDFGTGQIRMRGGTPSIFDAEQGKISGDPLTFSIASDEIQVGSKTGVRATGRTIVHK